MIKLTEHTPSSIYNILILNTDTNIDIIDTRDDQKYDIFDKRC